MSAAPDARLAVEISACIESGRYGEALDLITRGLATAPDDPDLLFARGSTLFAWGRVLEAREAFSGMAARGLAHERLFLNLGWSHFETGNADEADHWMRKAATASPGMDEAQYGLAVVLLRQGRIDEAAAACERAVAKSPARFPYLVCLGLCRLEQNQPDAAEALFRRAVAVDAEQAIGWANLAVALDAQGRDSEVLEALEQAERVGAGSPDDTDGFVDIAARMLAEGRTREALALLESNLAQRPSARGHGKYALALLTAGRLIEGWHRYEFRWLSDSLMPYRADSRRPAWAGQDLRGRTVLLRREQGFGDAIQFLRYAPCLKALGAATLLDDFSDLAYGFDGVDQVFDGNASPPEHDYYVNLMSLPRVFGSAVDSIPVPIPYVRPDPGRRQKWAKRLEACASPRVGLVWAGSPAHVRDRERSISLSALRPVLDVEGFSFVSLQKGAPGAQVEQSAAIGDVFDLGGELGDFGDTAAVIAELDLVLCVDTAVAHLAGALGKPVWLMLPHPADWRWMEAREDTPWYPTMRLFRQGDRGDWTRVVERVAAALRDLPERKSGSEQVAAPPRSDAPLLLPQCRPGLPAGHRPGFSAVAETRAGILQYLPDEPEEGDSIGWFGEYLQKQLDLLATLVRPGSTIVEVGAGVGVHALVMSALVGPTGHLLLYESRPLVRRILRQNLSANRVGNVTVMRHGLGSAVASNACAEDDGATQAEIRDAARARPCAETLDDLRLRSLDWLKVAHHAAALAVLDGAANTLWQLRPWLLLGASDESLLAKLAIRAREFGYRCWRNEVPLFNPGNFNRRPVDPTLGHTKLVLLAIPEETEVDVPLDGCVELS